MSVKTSIKGRVSRERHARMRNSRAAFTLVELLVVVAAIVALFLGMISLTATPRARTKAQRIVCVNNLKNVGVAFRIYANDEKGRFPCETTNAMGEIERDLRKDPYFHFLKLTNVLSVPFLLHCPSDSRVRAETSTNFSLKNISYFVSADAGNAYPQSFLAGDRNVTTNGVTLQTGIHRIGSNAEVGWDNTMHRQQGNTVLADGSVQQLSRARFREQLRNSGLTNVTFAIP